MEAALAPKAEAYCGDAEGWGVEDQEGKVAEEEEGVVAGEEAREELEGAGRD